MESKADGQVRGAARVRPRRISWVGVLLLVVVACLAALSDADTRAVMVMSAVLLFPMSGLHEAGHLLGASLVGFRFESLTIGPLRLARSGHRIALTLLKGNVPLGVAACSPTNDGHLRPRLAAMIAAGPLVNLLLAASAAILFTRSGYQ